MLKHHCHLAPCQNVNSSHGSLNKSSDASKIYADQLNVKVLHPTWNRFKGSVKWEYTECLLINIDIKKHINTIFKNLKQEIFALTKSDKTFG